MKPERIGTYIKLEQETHKASRAFSDFKYYSDKEVVPGVENLSDEQRFERVFETVVSYAELTEHGHRKFGKIEWRKYHAPMRLVTAANGEEYGLVFSVETNRNGYRSAETKIVNAQWYDLEKKHADTTFGPYEGVHNRPIDMAMLEHVEWSVEAYINGVDPNEAIKSDSFYNI